MWPALVLLDRDGVINHDSANYILRPQDWRPIDGSLGAIAKLTAAGIPVVICTNQSAIGGGLLSESGLAAIHQTLLEAVTAAGGQVAAIDYCPHAPDDRCPCRKPAPGLIHKALLRHQVKAKDALMIGDSQRDLEAAENAGVTAWLVRTGNGAKTAAEWGADTQPPVYANLADAVDALLETRS